MLFYKEKLLSQSQLKRLSEHKYSCNSISILDNCLQPWWNWLVSQVPMWLAPNLITILGLMVNIVTTLILVWYCPDAKTEPPRWACALCGLGLFVYQSLDAIDGKQARRTNSSTPLGELFDHGCDSISTVFVALSACIAVQLGHYPTWMFFQCFCAITLFYCAHWQTYVSGTLQFGRVDVTEAQFIIITIHIISATFGPHIWMYQISSWFELRYCMGLLILSGVLWALYNMLTVIVNGGCGKNGSTVAIPYINWAWNFGMCIIFIMGYVHVFFGFWQSFSRGGVGKNGSTVAQKEETEVSMPPFNIRNKAFQNKSLPEGTSVLSPIIPFGLVVVPAFIICQKSPDHIFESHPALYVLAFGMVAAKVTNRLVVAHMTKSEMEYLDWALLGPSLLFLNQYFNNFFAEYWVLWLCMVLSLVDLLRYCSQVCLEICDHLKIELFRIPFPPRVAPVMQPSDKNDPDAVASSDAEDESPLLPPDK